MMESSVPAVPAARWWRHGPFVQRRLACAPQPVPPDPFHVPTSTTKAGSKSAFSRPYPWGFAITLVRPTR